VPGSSIDTLIDAFVRACLDVFGAERVEGVILHGSAHKGGGIPGYSDIDFMVFLTPECFDPEGELPDDDVFAIQERIGPLPWREAGFLYPQAYFYDARRLPHWWTGPAPGSYRVLFGALPAEAVPTEERLRLASKRLLAEQLRAQLVGMLRNFADADDASLPRRLRLLGTAVTPAVFALASLESDDVLSLWAQPKLAALARLEELHPNAEGPGLARRFYDSVARLYQGDFDADLGRETFRVGVGFLRWAIATARTRS
jgi:hypothetical protein